MASTSFATDGDKQASTYDFAKKKYGTFGEKISVYSNYFKMRINSSKLYRYNLEINLQDQIENRSDRNVPQRSKLSQQKKMIKEYNFLVFEKLFKKETLIFSSEPVFDGRNLYSKTKLIIPDKKFKTKIKLETSEKKKRKHALIFDVAITIPAEIESHELDLSILNERNIKNAEKHTQALDAILKYGSKSHKLVLGSHLFLRKSDIVSLPLDQRKAIRVDLGNMKEIGFGHYQSTKLTENGVQLNVDRVAIVFNKGGKLINIIEQICTEIRSQQQRSNPSVPQRQIEITKNFKLGQMEHKIINNELKNLEFFVDHISYRPKNKITCITDKTVGEIFFNQKLENGEIQKKSVKQYFEETYKDYMDKNINGELFANLPCVQVGKINPKYFPMEVVSIVEDQYCMKKLKSRNQTTMTRICSDQKPTKRFIEYEAHVKNLINTSKNEQMDYLKHFGIDLNSKYSECNARILEPGCLLFKEKNIEPKDGKWNNNNTQFVIPTTNIKDNWMVVNIIKEFNNELKFAPNENQVKSFIDLVLKCAKNNGIDLAWPHKTVYKEVYRGRQDLDDAMHDYLYDFKKENKDLKLIMYFIPKLDELYENIKYLSEIVYGIPTQCVSQEKFRTQMPYVSNLMLKINAKLGGSNFHLSKNSKVGFLKKITMIMGLDSTKSSERDKLTYSISSVVATYDKEMVNYYSKCVVQLKQHLEIVKLDEITKELLENFYNSNRRYPDYLLIYRNGIGDSQFPEIIEKELNLIKKAFTEINPNYSPKVTFIVVQKGHHTRFLPVDERKRIQKSQNVLPGTCVDNTITSNCYSDFYLCAHYGELGTLRPTRYIVLHDETEFSGDDIQQSTNLLSHLFPRCMKVTSVPAPVLYSHLLSKRAKIYLDASAEKFYEGISESEIRELNQKIQVKDNLRNVLYYV